MADIDDYDALPPPIRAWLAGSDDDYLAGVVLGYWRGFSGSVEQFLDVLEHAG